LQLILTESQTKILSKQAKEQIPNESCALLFGKSENENLVVKEIFLTDNAEKSPINFTISNEQLIKAYQKAEDKKMEVVGIFHSHPNSEPYPSSTDDKFMKINPVVWLIFSCKSNDFKAYILDSHIVEVPIKIV
jgi:[CysO sulfur-carrier protein]-S-L-cysteine hydrolase